MLGSGERANGSAYLREEALGGIAARMQELAQRYNSAATAWVSPNADYFDVLVEVRKVQEEK